MLFLECQLLIVQLICTQCYFLYTCIARAPTAYIRIRTVRTCVPFSPQSSCTNTAIFVNYTDCVRTSAHILTASLTLTAEWLSVISPLSDYLAVLKISLAGMRSKWAWLIRILQIFARSARNLYCAYLFTKFCGRPCIWDVL